MVILLWIGYNHFIQIQPQAQGRNPIPPLIFCLVMISYGIRPLLPKLLRHTPKSRKPNPETYKHLRGEAFRLIPDELSIIKTESDDTVFEVIMESHYSGAIATLIAFLHGEASIYLSTGSAVIGGGQHQTVQQAAREMNLLAQQYIGSCKPTQDYPLPSPGEIMFYLRTKANLYTISVLESELGKSPLLPLFSAGQNVITQIRLVTNISKATQGS